MRHVIKYNELEKLVREQEIMEKHYGIKSIPMNEPIFTTSQETDVMELIRDGLTIDEILSVIRKW
jgi:hypothetical protein